MDLIPITDDDLRVIRRYGIRSVFDAKNAMLRHRDDEEVAYLYAKWIAASAAIPRCICIMRTANV